MKIDLTKDGLESVFTQWEIKTLEALAEGGEYTSGTLLAKVNTALGGNGVSQASVINFLEELTSWGAASKHVGYGKGGARGVYEFRHTMVTLREFLASLAESWARNMRNPSSEQSKMEGKDK
jgi:hypothetical protein